MDTIEFSKHIDPETLARIFKDFFEQHIAMYYMLKGLNFLSLNIHNMDDMSITYSIKLLNNEDINNIINILHRDSTSLIIYGNKIKPETYINGDQLIIKLKK